MCLSHLRIICSWRSTYTLIPNFVFLLHVYVLNVCLEDFFLMFHMVGECHCLVHCSMFHEIITQVVLNFEVFLFNRFCTDCKNKVLRAYNILIGELDCSKEKGYCAALYEGLRCCPHERHIHVCCETDFIAHLLGRAEPEFAGGYEYVIC